MKNVSFSLQQSFEDECSTLCRIITIVLQNGETLRRTDLDRAVKLGINEFKPSSMEISAVRQSLVGIQSGGTLSLVLGAGESGITEDMVRGRALDGATFVVEVLDYESPQFGTMILWTGLFGDIDFDERGRCQISIDSLLSQAQTNIGEVYSQECRNDFSDEQCRYPVEDLRVFFQMDGIDPNNYVFRSDDLISDDDNVYNYGVVTLTSGANAGTIIEVMSSQANGTIVLALPTPYPIDFGDFGEIVPGCSKQLSQCLNDYNNVLNYRGEPHVPTVDEQNIQTAVDRSVPLPKAADVTTKDTFLRG